MFEKGKDFMKYGFKTIIVWEEEFENEQNIANKIRGVLSE